ncbi:MAG TPA: TIGR03620 family F420-dependent LLM class oxidoreductase [Acidimicrobiia bacterium]|nr:TIGR03620 family F420-dependent LLM class oxidoreductase [Acidimicrobiia bacterium]
MTIELGRFGIWQRASDVTPETAFEIERLGYGALWIGGSPPGDLEVVDSVLAATETLAVATGIVNMWRDDAATVAQSYHRIDRRFPNRFMLGVGIGHPESTSEYRDPYHTILAYLDQLEAAGVPRDHLCLAALGPQVLRVSAKRTAGAHPYLTTHRHTTFARDVVGDGVLLAPEQTVIVGEPADADERAKAFVTRYLRLVNYRTNLLREGWEQSDLENGGSDALISELVLRGSAGEVARGIESHLDAGADHVCIQDLGPDPLASFRALAEVLF